jgi:hypothetical protein
VFGVLMDGGKGCRDDSCGSHGLVSWVQIRSGSCASCSGTLRELCSAGQEACWMMTMGSCEGV